MASPNTTFTELVSTTFRKHRKDIKDNVSKNNALLRRLYAKGNYRREDGGLTIAIPLDYQQNSTYQRYSDWDVLNISQSDVITSAEYQWRQIAINVIASGRELRINSGESKIIALAKARMKNAIRSFKNNFSSDIYSDGTLTNQVNGLQALIADAGTGTVGGIDSGTWTFWQNTVQSAAAPLQGGGAVTVSATTIEGQMMLPLWLELCRGDDKPDLIVMSNDWYSFFESSQVSNKRYVDKDMADAGFENLRYKGATVLFDGGSGIPGAHMYFINTDYYELVVHQDADMDVVEGERPYNQDGSVTPILWMGNLTCSNRRLQGVGKA
jgi:hypothetical protein